MRVKLTDHQLQIIEQLCDRVNRHDFKIDSNSCSDEELHVLQELDQANANTPYGGWWNDDDTINVVVEYDYGHGQYSVYCGNGWI